MCSLAHAALFYAIFVFFVTGLGARIDFFLLHFTFRETLPQSAEFSRPPPPLPPVFFRTQVSCSHLGVVMFNLRILQEMKDGLSLGI